MPSGHSEATLIARSYEHQPLRCPECGAAMVQKACITDPFEIQRFLQSLGAAPYRAPLRSNYQRISVLPVPRVL